MIYLKLAWRNIFRNKRRTFLASLAIGIGVGALIFVDGLLIGWEENMVRTATSTYLGQGQVHHRDYRDTLEVDKTIGNPEILVKRLEANPDILSVTCRTQSFAIIASPRNVQSIMINGINPLTERNISKIDDAIIEGEYLKDTGRDKILIGKKLADILEVEPGDKVTITTAQAKTGNTSQDMFRIGGIFELKIREMDRSMAFIDLERCQKLLGLQQDVHEIPFSFKDINMSRNVNHPVWKLADNPDLEILNWLELMPELKVMLKWLNVSMLIMSCVLFTIVAAGIVNTLFMSLYERMFEFGVLRAVGTRPMNMALLIIFEAGALAVISSVVGSFMGGIMIRFFNRIGLDYSDTEFVNVAIIDRIYPVMETYQFIVYPIGLIVFTMIVGIYPAVHAARMTPSKAMKKGL